MHGEQFFDRKEARRLQRLVSHLEPAASPDAKLAAVSRLLAAHAVASALRNEKGDALG